MLIGGQIPTKWGTKECSMPVIIRHSGHPREYGEVSSIMKALTIIQHSSNY